MSDILKHYRLDDGQLDTASLNQPLTRALAVECNALQARVDELQAAIKHHLSLDLVDNTDHPFYKLVYGDLGHGNKPVYSDGEYAEPTNATALTSMTIQQCPDCEGRQGQMRELKENLRELTYNYKEVLSSLNSVVKKLHWCPEWDGLLIWEGTPEFDVCLCFCDED